MHSITRAAIVAAAVIAILYLSGCGTGQTEELPTVEVADTVNEWEGMDRAVAAQRYVLASYTHAVEWRDAAIRYAAAVHADALADAQRAAEAEAAVEVQSSEPSYSGGGGAGGNFAAIRACESGGNYSTNTGNGYYGAYQFDLQTWQSVGGSGLPSDASPAEQDARAAQLYAQRGSSPWPVCG